MARKRAGTDTTANSLTFDDVLKGAVVVGGIALGLLILKSLMEETDDEESTAPSRRPSDTPTFCF